MHCPRPSGNDVDDVTNCGAAWRGDDADAPRKEWNRAFDLRREQAFRLQPRLCLFEGELQCAGADRLKRLDDQLVLALLLVNAQPPARANLQSIFEPKTDSLIAAAIARRAQLCGLIFQREVPMPGSVLAKIRNLAFDPNGGETFFKSIANLDCQFRNAEWMAFGFVKEGCEKCLLQLCL